MAIWAVGTTNKAKLDSVFSAACMCFPGEQHDVRAVSVSSCVSAQPMSAEESQKGARHRAYEALRLVPEAHYGVGLEGGLEKISEKWFECGWAYVVEQWSGRYGIGSSARFELSQKLMSKILNEGKELSEVMDEVTGQTDVRSGQGAMGILTAGHLNRAASYTHGLVFALAPFLSDGLGDVRDITLKGLEAVREADVVYLEAYTSFLINNSVEGLAEAYGRPVLLADREMVESGSVLQGASEKKVVLLVVGDVFGATTHSDLVVRCHEQGIACRVIHNTSIINAVGCCGLQLYRFGQVISLCFWTETWRPDSWYNKLKLNREAGLHTLVLLDIKVKEISDENLARGRKIYEPPRYMRISEAIDQILEVERQKKGGVVAVDGETMAVGLARVGSETQKIVAGKMRMLRELDFGDPLHSLIIAGDIHACEADHVNLFCLK